MTVLKKKTEDLERDAVTILFSSPIPVLDAGGISCPWKQEAVRNSSVTNVSEVRMCMGRKILWIAEIRMLDCKIQSDGISKVAGC